jgi:predicted RNA-binding Zn-ribbon protein involved in translation (DUF1610 family)
MKKLFVIIVSVIIMLNGFYLSANSENDNEPEAIHVDLPWSGLPSGGTYLEDYEYFSEMLIYAGIDFGNNTEGSCSAVAAGLVIQYFDEYIDQVIIPLQIPQSWEDECDASGNVLNASGNGYYDVSIPAGSTIYEALQRYIIGLSDDNTFGIGVYNLQSALMKYDDDQYCYSCQAEVYSDVNTSEGDMMRMAKQYISNNKPVIIVLEEYPHAVVAFGYDQDESSCLGNLYFHTGWDGLYTSNGQKVPNLGYCTKDDIDCIIPLSIEIHHTPYQLVSRTSLTHTYTCLHCGETFREGHKWQRVGLSYRCSVCGYRSNQIVLPQSINPLIINN